MTYFLNVAAQSNVTIPSLEKRPFHSTHTVLTTITEKNVIKWYQKFFPGKRHTWAEFDPLYRISFVLTSHIQYFSNVSKYFRRPIFASSHGAKIHVTRTGVAENFSWPTLDFIISVRLRAWMLVRWLRTLTIDKGKSINFEFPFL